MIPVIEANAQKIYPSINPEESIEPPQLYKKYMLIKVTKKRNIKNIKIKLS